MCMHACVCVCGWVGMRACACVESLVSTCPGSRGTDLLCGDGVWWLLEGASGSV